MLTGLCSAQNSQIFDQAFFVHLNYNNIGLEFCSTPENDQIPTHIEHKRGTGDFTVSVADKNENEILSSINLLLTDSAIHIEDMVKTSSITDFFYYDSNMPYVPLPE